MTGYILEKKRAASPKRKKEAHFSFSRKKGHIFSSSRNTFFLCYSYAGV